MITSIGLDIVENARLERDIRDYGERFLNRILSAAERQIYDRRQDKIAFLAGRFAAKEAVIKALGEYLDHKPTLSAIEILNRDDGGPRVVFPAEVRASLKGASCLISISHEQTYSVAIALIQEAQ